MLKSRKLIRAAEAEKRFPIEKLGNPTFFRGPSLMNSGRLTHSGTTNWSVCHWVCACVRETESKEGSSYLVCVSVCVRVRGCGCLCVWVCACAWVCVPVRPWSEQWHRKVKEASVGWCVRHVRTEVDGRGVDLGVGRDVGDSGEKVVHHTRIVRVVYRRTVEPKGDESARWYANVFRHDIALKVPESCSLASVTLIAECMRRRNLC